MCEFQKYGPAGSVTTQSYLCVLAPNIISEKIFVFLWFWYATLAVVIVLNICLVMMMAFRSLKIRGYFMMASVVTAQVLYCLSFKSWFVRYLLKLGKLVEQHKLYPNGDVRSRTQKYLLFLFSLFFILSFKTVFLFEFSSSLRMIYE
jgi:hypothetical protein